MYKALDPRTVGQSICPVGIESALGPRHHLVDIIATRLPDAISQGRADWSDPALRLNAGIREPVPPTVVPLRGF